MKKKNGNGHDVLTKLAASVDARFGKVDKNLKAMRKDFKKLFSYVAYIDEEMQKHAKDKTLHAGR